MDMEELSKSQIVLLTLLVSFVTSIATGIVTVSLMDQAPPVIAQTVNRVIERTVETVTPAKGSQAAATVVTQEKTVVVNQQDLISQAIARIAPSLVRIYSTQDTPVFLGIGIVLDTSGTIVTDIGALDERSEAVLALSDDTRVRAFVNRREKDIGIAFMSAATSTSEGKPIEWKPVAIATDQSVLGEVVVAISGKTVQRIADGLVSAIIPATPSSVSVIDTTVSEDSILNGTPLINTNGSVVGVSTIVSRASSQSGFIAASVLLAPPAGAKKP